MNGCHWKNRRELIAGLLLSILLSLHTPLLRLVYGLVPGYSLFRLPNRILFKGDDSGLESKFSADLLRDFHIEWLVDGRQDSPVKESLDEVLGFLLHLL